MIIAQMIDWPQLVAPIKLTFSKSKVATVVVVDHKASVGRDSQIQLHKAVGQHEYEKLEHN